MVVTVDISKLIAGMGSLKDRSLRTSVSRAINTTVTSGRTQLKREASKIYNLKIGDSASELPIRRATSANMVGKIMARSSLIPMEKFSPTIKTETVTSKVKPRKGGFNKYYSSVKKTKNRKQGVFVTILKSKGKQQIPSAFLLSTGKWSGKIAARGKYSERFSFLFRRSRISSGMDFPIGALKGLSIISSVTNKDLIRKMEPVVVKKFQDRIVHELTKGVKYGPNNS